MQTMCYVLKTLMFFNSICITMCFDYDTKISNYIETTKLFDDYFFKIILFCNMPCPITLYRSPNDKLSYPSNGYVTFTTPLGVNSEVVFFLLKKKEIDW